MANQIVHLSIDDKFLGEFFIPNLESFIGLENNLFIIIIDEKPKFPIMHEKAKIIYVKKNNIRNLFRKIWPFNKLIIHCFIHQMRKAVYNLPKSVEITAIFFGYEFYSLINETSLYQKETTLYNNTINKRKEINEYNKLLNVFFLAKLRKYRWSYIISRSLKRIDKIAHFIPHEYQFFKNKLNLNATYINFNFGTIEQILSLNENKYSPLGNNILIGNSGNITNNHLDIIKGIDQSVIFNNVKIYCPLSYSITSKDYINKIISKGKEKFKDSFIPIENYLTLAEFNTLLSSCNKVIFSHHRSQGGTSIWSALYRGSDLYLSPNNPMYHFLKDLGAVIFKTTEKIDLKKTLTDKQKENNKSILKKYFSAKVVKSKYIELIGN